MNVFSVSFFIHVMCLCRIKAYLSDPRLLNGSVLTMLTGLLENSYSTSIMPKSSTAIKSCLEK